MKPNRILTDFVNAVIHNRQGLALWFLPGNEGLNALIASRQDIMTGHQFGAVSGRQGFVFAPFLPDEKYPTILLSQGKFLKGYDEIAGYDTYPDSPVEADISDRFYEVSRTQHIQNCQSIIRKIKQDKAEKVVLSRVKKVHSSGHPADLLIQIKSLYPDAFCYLFYTPQTGLWLGATPETLLTAQNEVIKTMALAGTRQHRPDVKTERPWPLKEQKEQNFVSGFIVEELNKLGINKIMISKPYTKPAGPVEHIRTDFEIDIRGTGQSAGSIIDVLHPTPAVCGQPKKAALKIIKETEKHDRAYYTGFLGPLNMEGQTALFVNLRCMKASGQAFFLFAGGGLTKDSDAVAEWEETEMKASILEKVLRND